MSSCKRAHLSPVVVQWVCWTRLRLAWIHLTDGEPLQFNFTMSQVGKFFIIQVLTIYLCTAQGNQWILLLLARSQILFISLFLKESLELIKILVLKVRIWGKMLDYLGQFLVYRSTKRTRIIDIDDRHSLLRLTQLTRNGWNNMCALQLHRCRRFLSLLVHVLDSQFKLQW